MYMFGTFGVVVVILRRKVLVFDLGVVTMDVFDERRCVPRSSVLHPGSTGTQKRRTAHFMA